MFPRVPRSMLVRPWLALLMLLAGAAALSAQTTVRSIAASTVADEAVVTIEASGTLPAPTVGALDGPPRIFLDFAGVRTATAGLVRTRDPRVRRVRVAINSAAPLVTRVVIDLTAVLPHRVEFATGRVMVFIGAGAPAAAPNTAAIRDPGVGVRPATAGPNPSAPPVAPPAANAAPSSTTIPPVQALPPPIPDANDLRSAPRLPPAAASPSSSSASSSATTPAPKPPYRPPAMPPPARDLEKYRAQVNPLLDRFKLQMPILEQMESLDDDLGSRMPFVMTEFDRLREELEAIKPPDSLRTQHDLLLQGARLGSTAARVRLEAIQTGRAELRRNAASAAAGATLMLDRAFAEVGYGVDR